MTDLQKIIERMEYRINDLSVGLLKLKLRVDELESQVSIYRQEENSVTVIRPDYSDVIKPYEDKIRKAQEILEIVLNNLRIMGYPSGLSSGFHNIRDVLADDIAIQGSKIKDTLDETKQHIIKDKGND